MTVVEREELALLVFGEEFGFSDDVEVHSGFGLGWDCKQGLF
jgi:hypothetical protein